MLKTNEYDIISSVKGGIYMSIDIHNYADSIDNNKHITFYDVYKTLLNGIDCIVCLESSADLLELYNLTNCS